MAEKPDEGKRRQRRQPRYEEAEGASRVGLVECVQRRRSHSFATLRGALGAFYQTTLISMNIDTLVHINTKCKLDVVRCFFYTLRQAPLGTGRGGAHL